MAVCKLKLSGGGAGGGLRAPRPGRAAPPRGQRAGTITFSQNSLTFQIGSNANQTARVSMKSTRAENLGNGVANNSGFRSFADINLTMKPIDSNTYFTGVPSPAAAGLSLLPIFIVAAKAAPLLMQDKRPSNRANNSP